MCVCVCVCVCVCRVKERRSSRSSSTWGPLQHREDLPLGAGEGDSGLSSALLAQDRGVAQTLTGPVCATQWSLRLLLGLLLASPLSLNTSGNNLHQTADSTHPPEDPPPASGPCELPPAATTASIFSSSTMATLSSVFLRFSCSFLISSRKRFSFVGFSAQAAAAGAVTAVVEAGSAEVGDVGEPPVHSCSTVMFFRLSRIFKASFSSLKPREEVSLLGFSAPFSAPTGGRENHQACCYLTTQRGRRCPTTIHRSISPQPHRNNPLTTPS